MTAAAYLLLSWPLPATPLRRVISEYRRERYSEVERFSQSSMGTLTGLTAGKGRSERDHGSEVGEEE